ncbi:MAG: hypothetical protein GX907_01210 [Clostridiaceae bacterium]|nr:hypothetical protein [Clostridiaceae bacterium]
MRGFGITVAASSVADMDGSWEWGPWSEWQSGRRTDTGGIISSDDLSPGADWLQFRARFGSPRFIGSAVLDGVEIE